MNTVITCRACGNHFYKHYRFCPFCGNKKPEPELAVILDKTFKKVEKIRAKNYLERLTILEQKLFDMEKELEDIEKLRFC